MYFHMCKIKDEKSFRIVLKGIHLPEELKQEINSTDHIVRNI
jgi:hypothetical protein